MIDYLDLKLPDEQIQSLSSLGLAHIGDCVYELMVRSYIVCHGLLTAGSLHKATIRYVSAAAQAEAMAKALALLTEEELAVYKRGRNAHVHSVPKNADIRQYHAATGLEALFGYLYLKDRHERLNELFAKMMEES